MPLPLLVPLLLKIAGQIFYDEVVEDQTPLSLGLGRSAPRGPVSPARRKLRVMIAAAHADFAVDERERQRVLEAAAADEPLRRLLDHELSEPQALEAILQGVEDAAEKEALYRAALEVLRGGEDVPAEEEFLAELASRLGLSPARAAELRASPCS